MTNASRETIFLEEAEILSHEHLAGDQHLLELKAPECAAHALPGSFIHLRCGEGLALRRPLSIMRAIADRGTLQILYKVVGEGTRLLSRRAPGERLSTLGPIGEPFRTRPERPRPLLIGGGVGMPPMIFLAEWLRRDPAFRPFVILGSEVPFPFAARPSRLLMPGLPPAVTATMPLLDDWGIPCRLASLQGYPGCHEGYVTELAALWLDGLEAGVRDEVEIFSCGPHPMLEAVAALARDYGLPCQVSLEEFMACGVGGCAGCVVAVDTPEGPAMKRVCVDGPVFDAASVFPAS